MAKKLQQRSHCERTLRNTPQGFREIERKKKRNKSRRRTEENLPLVGKTTTQPNADFSSIRAGERVVRIRTTRPASFEAFDRQHLALAKSAYGKKDSEEEGQTCTQRSTLQKRFDRRQIERDSRYLGVGKFAPTKRAGKMEPPFPRKCTTGSGTIWSARGVLSNLLD